MREDSENLRDWESRTPTLKKPKEPRHIPFAPSRLCEGLFLDPRIVVDHTLNKK